MKHFCTKNGQDVVRPALSFEIKELEYLTGEKAHVYSVALEGDDKTLLEHFFDENSEFRSDLKKIVNKLFVMAHDTGCRKCFFKEGEGSLGDGMVALQDTGRLRLYGVYFHDAVILLGSGGYKPLGVKAYEDYPPLNEKAQLMKGIAKAINEMIKRKELMINEDGTLEVLV